MSARILIVQLAHFGDCLYATTLAKQIKHDIPNAHITWAIAARYRSILDNNTHVDAVWEVPIFGRSIDTADWNVFRAEAEARKARGQFDRILYTQDVLQSFRTTLRRAVFEIGGFPITVGVAPVVHLTEEELGRVRSFADRHRLGSFREVVLVECAPGSTQSRMNVPFGIELAQRILRKRSDTCFVLSSSERLPVADARIVDGSELSYRENLGLTHYCTLLVGCSSGITWLATSEGAKRLPMLQLLDERSPVFCGVNFDFEAQGLPNADIIELTRYDVDLAVHCVDEILRRGAKAAKLGFNQRYAPNVHSLKWATRALAERGNSLGAIWRFINRYIADNKALQNPIRVHRAALLVAAAYQKARQSNGLVARLARKGLRPARSLLHYLNLGKGKEELAS